MTMHLANEVHEIVYQEMIDLLRRHRDVTPVQQLAIAANLVGKLLAMQDQTRVSVQLAAEIIRGNIEAGNRQVIDRLRRDAVGARN